MTYAELDEFVTDTALIVKADFKQRFGKELDTDFEQRLCDHLWADLISGIREDEQ